MRPGRWVSVGLLLQQLGCAHAPPPPDSTSRVTASTAPGVCRPAARYRAHEFRDDAGVVQVYADPAVTPMQTITGVGTMALAARRDLRAFFGIPGPETYRIFIAATTAEFDELGGSKTDWAKYDWIVGSRMRDGSHLMRDPATWSTASRAFVKVDELIKHEMAHTFTHALNGKGRAVACEEASGDLGHWLWFEEGLASFASGQHLTWRARAKFDFENHPHFDQIASYGNYTTAASAVEYLVSRYSRERVLELVRRLPGNYSAAEHEADVMPTVAEVFAPTAVADLERGWRKFALRTYRTQP